jgi:hypothetical protein
MPFTFDEADEILVPPSRAAIGRMGEDAIVKDLIRRRFYVYVPVIPRSPCDMIILKGTQTLRVEVKTSTQGRHDPEQRQRSQHDVLAQLTLSSGRVRYRPTPEKLILNFDAQIERCFWCGEEQPKGETLLSVRCDCPGAVEARQYDPASLNETYLEALVKYPRLRRS